MHNKFIGWVNGRKAEPIGAYWGTSGVCLAHRASSGAIVLAYVPANKDLNTLAWEEAVLKMEVLCGLKRGRMALAVALSADDVFLRTMTIPEGLNDSQLEQVAIVEAVANVPVPPEEICLDFLRGDEGNSDGVVRLAFCRRERVDAILAHAEEVRIPVHVVDRDIQAIHDAITVRAKYGSHKIAYPFGLFLTDISPRFVVCLGPTEFEAYPIRLPQNTDENFMDDIASQLGNCWMRCRMARSKVDTTLTQVYVIGDFWAPELQMEFSTKHNNFPVTKFPSEMAVGDITLGDQVPEEIALIATGMANRVLD